MSVKCTTVVGLVAISVLFGAAYYYFYGREYVYHFSEAQLQQALSARLPVETSYLFILQVTFDNPRITLVEGSDRVNAGLDVTLNIRLGHQPLPLGGSLDVSGGIRYDDANGQFFLTDSIIEHLAVQGIPEQYMLRVSGALSKALGEYYASHPIYTLSNLDARQAAARLVLKNVVVERRELVVTLGVGT